MTTADNESYSRIVSTAHAHACAVSSHLTVSRVSKVRSRNDSIHPSDQWTLDTHRDVIGTTRTTTTVPLNVDYKSLLGGKCSTNQNCHSANAACMNSLCTCPRHYFAIDEWTCLKDSGTRRLLSMHLSCALIRRLQRGLDGGGQFVVVDDNNHNNRDDQHHLVAVVIINDPSDSRGSQAHVSIPLSTQPAMCSRGRQFPLHHLWTLCLQHGLQTRSDQRRTALHARHESG